MVTAFIRHRVRDYAVWRSVYDAFTGSAGGAAAGEPLVYRSVDDPRDLLVIHNFASEGELPAWIDDGSRRRAMIEAGVEGSPSVDLCFDRVDAEGLHERDNRPAADHSETLRAIERQRLDALVTRDMARALSLHAADFQLVTPHGGVLSREEYLRIVASGQLAYKSFDILSEISVVSCAHLAVLRYRARIDGAFEGRREIVEAWHTDSYRHGPKGWEAIRSQATPIAAD